MHRLGWAAGPGPGALGRYLRPCERPDECATVRPVGASPAVSVRAAGEFGPPLTLCIIYSTLSAMVEMLKTAAFNAWFSGLRDLQAVARITVRIDRLAGGNAGD